MPAKETVPRELDKELMRLARSCRTDNYKAVAVRCNIGPNELRFSTLAKLLTVVNEREKAQRAPLLAAVVVNKKSKMPGPGFFKWARDHGLIQGSDREFWESELERVCSYWADSDRSPIEKIDRSPNRQTANPSSRRNMSPMTLVRSLFARL